MRLSIRKEAEHDIASATIWYDRQQLGVGSQLLTELEQIFERISENPLLFPEIQSGIRRALTGLFPYAVYYRVSENGITVYAVLHQRRSPAAWQRD